MSGGEAVRGRVDPDGRLVEAEPRLMALHRAAGDASSIRADPSASQGRVALPF